MSDKWKGFFQARKEKKPGVASGHRLVVMPKDWNKKKTELKPVVKMKDQKFQNVINGLKNAKILPAQGQKNKPQGGNIGNKIQGPGRGRDGPPGRR